MADGPNPFADPLRFQRQAPECAIVIFGASGDLTKRKLIPALYRLAYDSRLPASFSIVGVSRSPLSDDAFRDAMREAVQNFSEDTAFDPNLWSQFAPNLYYIPGDMKDAALYHAIAARLQQIGQRNVLFYLATQPSYYPVVAQQLAAAGMTNGPGALQPSGGWKRIVVEKPFGHDLLSARQLSACLQTVFPEDEIYRIDHYLGKETVQNILAFRFGNGIFEPLWNRRYVNQVQITAAESIGVEGRGAYYQESGALRDMVQNHLLQVLATVAMEPVPAFEPDAVRDERAKLLRSIHVLKPGETPQNATPGQYAGFRDEPGVDAASNTPTFVAARFLIDNWRWAGVPFYVRTGKKLAKRTTEIAIQYNSAPLSLFASADSQLEQRPNLLILRIQPEEGISLRFLSKQPGSGMHLRPVSMDFKYGTSFGGRSPSAYETLLVDALLGDATLYTRQDMVEASWRVVEPILDYFESRRFPFPNYEPGTWGPAAADEMLARFGHRWRNG
ncbi:MAG TPA: glucose-6-phosphate dehydrogenase [Bryobacteraceae bacterium]|nr:glucose-6-phosphate dehydrogenase [Bryobacteraceae bacterium]